MPTAVCRVEPGRQATTKAIIAFNAPAIEARTDYVLSIQATAGKALVVPVQPLTLTPFPRTAPGLLDENMA